MKGDNAHGTMCPAPHLTPKMIVAVVHMCFDNIASSLSCLVQTTQVYEPISLYSSVGQGLSARLATRRGGQKTSQTLNSVPPLACFYVLSMVARRRRCFRTYVEVSLRRLTAQVNRTGRLKCVGHRRDAYKGFDEVLDLSADGVFSISFQHRHPHHPHNSSSYSAIA